LDIAPPTAKPSMNLAAQGVSKRITPTKTVSPQNAFTAIDFIPQTPMSAQSSKKPVAIKDNTLKINYLIHPQKTLPDYTLKFNHRLNELITNHPNSQNSSNKANRTPNPLILSQYQLPPPLSVYEFSLPISKTPKDN
jgi:hypothetical protein